MGPKSFCNGESDHDASFDMLRRIGLRHEKEDKRESVCIDNTADGFTKVMAAVPTETTINPPLIALLGTMGFPMTTVVRTIHWISLP